MGSSWGCRTQAMALEAFRQSMQSQVRPRRRGMLAWRPIVIVTTAMRRLGWPQMAQERFRRPRRVVCLSRAKGKQLAS